VILMMSSALLAGGLYPWSRRLLLSRLIGVLVPRLAFQWLYGWINGRDAFALWALAVTLACRLPVDILAARLCRRGGGVVASVT